MEIGQTEPVLTAIIHGREQTDRTFHAINHPYRSTRTRAYHLIHLHRLGNPHGAQTMNPLQDHPVPTRFKLSALWTATMFCYVYGDYFGLYLPNKLASLAQGRMGPLGQASPGVLVAVSVMMAVPSLLIAATLFLPPAVCRWSNIVLGLMYTAIMAISLPGAAPFYVTLAAFEMMLTGLVALVAWTWPTTIKEGK